jgi:hypothetical protein
MGIFSKAFQKRKDKLAQHAAAQMEPGAPPGDSVGLIT